MWTLSEQNTETKALANPHKTLLEPVLLPGTDCAYSIGRKNCDITVGSGGGLSSVSRHHATLHIGRLGGTTPPALQLEDKSKFGTFVNGEKVNGTVPLVDDDMLRFGVRECHHVLLRLCPIYIRCNWSPANSLSQVLKSQPSASANPNVTQVIETHHLLTIICCHFSSQVWQLSGILGRVSRTFRGAANHVAPRYYEAPDSALLEDFLKVLHPMTWGGDDNWAAGDELKLATEESFERVKPVKFEGAEIISAVLVQSDDGIGSLVPDVDLENSGEEDSEAHALADKLREDGHGELADMVEKIAKEVDHALEYELDKEEVERVIEDSKAAADKLRAAGLTEEAALMDEMVAKLEEALHAHQELEWCSNAGYGYACFCEVKLKIALPINDDMQQLSDLLKISSVLSVDEETRTVDLRWIPTTEKAYIETKLERAKAALKNEFTIRQGADGWFVRARITEAHRSQLISETSVVLWERSFSRLSSPELSALWEGHIHSVVREGVSWCDSFVKPYLVDSLNKHVDHLASVERCDYHPNSGEIVRDHLHPAMYPYIRGVTETVSLPPQLEPGETDMWGRIYEDSIYQWLPTQFGIDEGGRCTINGYINNLDRDRHAALYADLERLFSKFVPHFESVYTYARQTKFLSADGTALGTAWPLGYDPKIEGRDFGDWPPDNRHYTNDGEPLYKAYAEPSPSAFVYSLRNRSLQVITKIVDYELGDDPYEGVWHVEGMPHENIVATGLYILQRGDGIEGGDLIFKRAFVEREAGCMNKVCGQETGQVARNFIDAGMFPLGGIRTPEGRMIVFPNSHIHKVTKMVKRATVKDSQKQVRRIVVFFLVNPEREIVSTQHVVTPQQHVMSLEEAMTHRLALMKERRLHKQDWNVREIGLCEH